MKKQSRVLSMILVLALICSMLVISVPVQAANIRLNRTEVTMRVGDKLKLKVIGTEKEVTWSSSKPKVVKVNKNGKITALKKGNAVITAKVGKKTLTCTIKVKKALEYDLCDTKWKKIRKYIKTKWGTPYVYGKWDCSKFVLDVMENAYGIEIPEGVRSSHSIGVWMTELSDPTKTFPLRAVPVKINVPTTKGACAQWDEWAATGVVKPGDIIVFYDEDDGLGEHAAIVGEYRSEVKNSEKFHGYVWHAWYPSAKDEWGMRGTIYSPMGNLIGANANGNDPDWEWVKSNADRCYDWYSVWRVLDSTETTTK